MARRNVLEPIELDLGSKGGSKGARHGQTSKNGISNDGHLMSENVEHITVGKKKNDYTAFSIVIDLAFISRSAELFTWHSQRTSSVGWAGDFAFLAFVVRQRGPHIYQGRRPMDPWIKGSCKSSPGVFGYRPGWEPLDGRHILDHTWESRTYQAGINCLYLGFADAQLNHNCEWTNLGSYMFLHILIYILTNWDACFLLWMQIVRHWASSRSHLHQRCRRCLGSCELIGGWCRQAQLNKIDFHREVTDQASRIWLKTMEDHWSTHI